MIELKDVKKEYSKGVAALNGVNLKVEQGEFVFIVGDSGSGKSTLIKLIMKELDPTSGTIVVNGQNLNKMRHRKIPMYRRAIGVVFQDFRLLKDRNIYENIALLRESQRRRAGSSRKRCRQRYLWWDLRRNTNHSRRSYPAESSRGLPLPGQL